MDDDAPHRLRWPQVLARVAGYPLLAAALYLLSCGPACYFLAARSERLDWALNAFYFPLEALVGVTDFNHPIFQYIVWWDALPGGPQERRLRNATPLPASEHLPLAEPLP